MFLALLIAEYAAISFELCLINEIRVGLGISIARGFRGWGKLMLFHPFNKFYGNSWSVWVDSTFQSNIIFFHLILKFILGVSTGTHLVQVNYKIL